MLLSLIFLPGMASAMGGNVPAGYPSTFMMGYVFEAHVDGAGRYVAAGSEFNTIDHYMAPMGSGWSASYKYLIGGPRAANGANDWWNAYPGSGGMPTNFMNAANARSYQPIFIYENMQAFLGNYDGGVYSAFQSATFMGQYFSDWADLMGVVNSWLGAHAGKVVTIDVEPDVWGYMQQNHNSDPASIPASVATATNPGGAYPWVPLTGFPNTVQGVARAMLYIKDAKLGANSSRLKLAFHVSSWAVAPNPATQQGAVNVAAHAAAIAGFVNACKTTITAGADWDLLFLDPADGDAGLYATNGLDPAGSTHWWDAANVTQPTFNRYRDWVDALSSATSLRCMLWQVPIGNQAYKSMNNTVGHYQDNKAEYFLNPTTGAGNICDWAAHGALGILWGRGSIIAAGAGYTCGTGGPDYWFNTWGTDYSGGTQDNIVNAGALGVNSTVADDDGGYLRNRLPAYFLSPCVLPAPGTPTSTFTRSATVSSTPSASPTRTPSSSPSATATLTSTPTPTPSRTAAATATPSVSASPSATSSATATTSRSATPSATASSSVTSLATATPSLSSTPTRSPSATLSATPTGTPPDTQGPTATISVTRTTTPTLTVSSTASFTCTLSSTPSATQTVTTSLTVSPTFSTSPTQVGTSTRTTSPSASPSLSPSFSASPTTLGINTATPSRTVTPTWSATLTLSASATPGMPPTATPTVTAGNAATTGDLELLDAVAWPQPNPRHVSVLLKGPWDRLRVRVYTTAMQALGEAGSAGAGADGWVCLELPPGLAWAANGAYYFTVKASHGDASSKLLKRRLVLAR